MKPKTVDEYIVLAPQEMQSRLYELRAAIMDAVPDAQEYMSYGMPSYKYKGRLVYFSLWKAHVGLYGVTTPVLQAHQDELKGYVTDKGAIRFPLNEPLPVALIKRLVEAQARRNDESAR